MEQSVDEVGRAASATPTRAASTNAAPTRWPPRSTAPPSSAHADNPTAPAATAGDAPAKNAVVYVVADEKSVDAATAARQRRVRASVHEPAQCSAPPAYVFGAGVMPTALLAGILERARIREVRHPGADTRTGAALHPDASRWPSSSAAGI